MKSWREEGRGESKSPPIIELPHDWVWNEFLVSQHWSDVRVLNEQPVWYVKQQYKFYELKAQYGMLGQG